MERGGWVGEKRRIVGRAWREKGVGKLRAAVVYVVSVVVGIVVPELVV
jgi:hypothetical protein